jgi:hypothetical protein
MTLPVELAILKLFANPLQIPKMNQGPMPGRC